MGFRLVLNLSLNLFFKRLETIASTREMVWFITQLRREFTADDGSFAAALAQRALSVFRLQEDNCFCTAAFRKTTI